MKPYRTVRSFWIVVHHRGNAAEMHGFGPFTTEDEARRDLENSAAAGDTCGKLVIEVNVPAENSLSVREDEDDRAQEYVH